MKQVKLTILFGSTNTNAGYSSWKVGRNEAEGEMGDEKNSTSDHFTVRYCNRRSDFPLGYRR